MHAGDVLQPIDFYGQSINSGATDATTEQASERLITSGIGAPHQNRCIVLSRDVTEPAHNLPRLILLKAG